MRIWKFFKKSTVKADEVPKGVQLTDRYPLYAMTNNEEYAKEFKEMHDMSKFITKVEKDILREEYTLYANRNRGTILDYYNIETDRGDGVEYARILMTMTEYTILESPDVCFLNDMYWLHNLLSPEFVTKKYREALDSIQYTNTYKIFNGITDEDFSFDDYSAPDMRIDQLAVYISVFYDLLK